ncbi:MAG: histidinol dehydrogenase, partial [Thermoanaerobaculia bacterium]
MTTTLKVFAADGRAGRRRVERLVGRGREILDPKTLRATRKIVEGVRKGGDRALLRYVRRLDGFPAASMADVELQRSASLGGGGAAGPGPPTPEGLPQGFAEALEEAIAAVTRYHRPQVHEGYRQEEDGVVVEERRSPLGRVGIYVPGGRASYPSTVVMTAIPARLAGVEEIVAATPPGPYRANAALRYTLHRLKVDEVWGMGGAHAVAALAYGTGSIRAVDKIVGPGNAWVTAAKSVVAAQVGIDSLAGPTEVVIVADGALEGDDGAVERLAADLLAQAEHDPRAAAVLVAHGDRRARRLARKVAKRVEARLEGLETAATARASLRAFGAALVVDTLEEAAALVERLAPEHLQLVGPDAESLAERTGPHLPAGAIFVGSATPEVFGDYVAGPSHVLPTCGTARFASALGVEDFVRRSHVVRFSEEAARAHAPAARALA